MRRELRRDDRELGRVDDDVDPLDEIVLDGELEDRVELAVLERQYLGVIADRVTNQGGCRPEPTQQVVGHPGGTAAPTSAPVMGSEVGLAHTSGSSTLTRADTSPSEQA
jgi:hypothetical protein